MMRNFLIIVVFIVCWSGYSQLKTATYCHNEYHGKVTKSGEVFDQNKLTCACDAYPLGSILKITNTENYKWVVVEVIDTGDWYSKAVYLSRKSTVYLSRKAFERVANIEKEVIKVTIQVIGYEKVKRY